MPDAKAKPVREMTAVEVAQTLKPYSVDQLLTELRRRGEIVCDGSNCDDASAEFSAFKEHEADQAKHHLGRGDLAEAAIYIARAHPDFERLPGLIRRVLPTAGV